MSNCYYYCVVMCTEWLKGNVLSDSVGPSGLHQLQGQLDSPARQERTAPDWQGCVHGQRLGRDLAPQPRSVTWTEVCGCEHLYQLLVLLLFQDHGEHDLRRLRPGWKRRLSGVCNCACVGTGTRTAHSDVLKSQIIMIKVIKTAWIIGSERGRKHFLNRKKIKDLNKHQSMVNQHGRTNCNHHPKTGHVHNHTSLWGSLLSKHLRQMLTKAKMISRTYWHSVTLLHNLSIFLLFKISLNI